MYLSKIISLMDSGSFIEAIGLSEIAINEMPGLYLYYQHLARAHLALGNFTQAISTIESGLSVNPTSVFLLKMKQDLLKSGIGIHKFKFAGQFEKLPNKSDTRQAEGGLRAQGFRKRSTTSEPLVSIVTVVYNNPYSLERCIRSVISQTYKNIEYILIDGGSDEHTINIIKKYESHIDYYVSEPDHGIYDAMNKGIQVAQGDYIALLNSDDEYNPEFVRKSVKAAVAYQADITYSNYHANGTDLAAEKVNHGILLGHLNICHNTFLVSKDCYNNVGPYDTELRIVSDAVWIRKAFKLEKNFCHVDDYLFTLSEGGLSSGSTDNNRRLFISEVVKSYTLQFQFLSEQEAEELYLFRFNNKRLTKVFEIAVRHENKKEFRIALRFYVEYCFKGRKNFELSHTESDSLFLEYVRACDLLGVDKKAVRIGTKHGCLSVFLSSINNIIETRKRSRVKTVLHYVSIFSAPSETFIYDLVCRLEESEDYDNFVLFDHRKLEEERPYNKQLFIPWNDFRPEVRNFIYKFIFDNLKPDAVIAHFALNEWKLHKRITPLGIKVPTLTMTHGIDVFMMKSDEAYRKYILEDFSTRLDTKFTAVSDYLKYELIKQGVPLRKVTKVYNTANQRFFEHRKTSGFFNYSRDLKILSVGRCIDLKGHIELLQCLRWFLNNVDLNISLTIVYGNGRDNLPQVEEAVHRLNLTGIVELIPFVNFTEEPDYFAQFDIYIQASKYSEDVFERSDTFGVATLEAVLSGLPVIVTDAGGLQEVVGENGRYSQIVQHSSGVELGKALKWFYDHPKTFSDNLEYAKQRMEFFSEQKQVRAISNELCLLTEQGPRVAFFSTSTVQGAGYAALRLFRGLRDLSIVDPIMFTTVRNHESERGLNVVRHPSGVGKGWTIFQDSENSKPGLTIFTMNHPCLDNTQLWEMVKDCGLINIHWVARFLSIENIAFLTSLGIPVIMTIRDMQPITGGCHYFHGCEKWMAACACCPQLINDYNDFPSKVLQAKRETYNFDNLTLVALSDHSKSILSRSPVFKDCRIEVIPNSIETDVFFPREKNQARKELGLPLGRKIIAYVPSFSSEVKGYKEAVAAFYKLDVRFDDNKPMVMLVGNKTPADDSIGLETISLGYISNNERLALAYSAADVVVVPSLEETFSNTTAEAISCGTPVVGFQTGAIPDLVIDGVSGYTCAIGDIDGLAEGIYRVLTESFDIEKCRQVAVSNLEFSLQAARYEKLITELVNESVDTSNQSANNHKYTFELYQPLINRLTSELLGAD